MHKFYFFKKLNTKHSQGFYYCFLFLFFSLNSSLFSQNTITGNVIDVQTNEPLIGANILIKGTSIGTITDLEGNFKLMSDQEFPWTIEASYTGYFTMDIEVIKEENIDIRMKTDAIGIDQIVVSASRKREKVQEAPASISILSAEKLAVSAATDNITRSLINTPGVQIQQQSASSINIEMRGQSRLFDTGVFPIMDYRSLIGPGIGTFNSNAVGLSTIDMQRIEVVRGPGSALYGPGVVTGVVHFITKNPIDYPGTTVEIFGGELNTGGASIRYAGRSENKKFGYKINAQYKRGDEFTLDAQEDSLQIAKFKTSVSQPAITNDIVDTTLPGEVLLTTKDLDSDGDGNMMADNWWNAAVNATLEFRPQDDLSVFVSGGYNQVKGVFYNSQGEGLTQASEYWTQARFQKGGLFGQIFYVNNNGGTKERPTFLYQTGLRTAVSRQQLEGQLQYNFEIPKLLNADFTVGADYRQAYSDSGHSVYGRYEEDDDYQIIGGYAQGKFAVAPKLDVLLAGRYDVFNFLNEGFLSPRAAVVYKPSPKHTFRATYNRAATPPSALNINIDFPVSVPARGLFDVWLGGQKNPQTFSDNPVIDLTVPGFPDLSVDAPGLPLSYVYGATTTGVLEQLIPAFEGTDLEPLIPAIVEYLSDPMNAPQGFTGNLVAYDLFTQQPYGELVPTQTARLSKTTAYEIGYKGLIADKLSVIADFYWNKTEGFTFFGATGPTYRLVSPNIATDLGGAVQTDIQPYLVSLGLDEATATAVAAQIGGGYQAAGAVLDESISPLYPIFGAVETSAVPQDDDLVHSPAGYRSFADESYDYWGTDIGLQYYFTNAFSAFFNYSYLSQNRWIPGEDNDDNLPFEYSLNAPQHKYRLGVNYTPVSGLRGSISFQHDDSFYASFGQFTGDADEKNLVDASIGYKMTNGLSVDVSAQNLFDNEYRALPNFPKIGRRVLVKLTYSFGVMN